MKFNGTAHQVTGATSTPTSSFAARYLNTSDPAELAKHCLRGPRPGPSSSKVSSPATSWWRRRTSAAAPRASMRPSAIKAAGIDCVIAKSFARIFYRNAINTGLAILECPEAVDGISEGDTVSVDADAGTITDETTGQTLASAAVPAVHQGDHRSGRPGCPYEERK